MVRLIDVLKIFKQIFPMRNGNLLVPVYIFIAILIGIPVSSDIFSPKQQYYEDLYRGRKESVGKAYDLIEEGHRQLREKMLPEAEESFKEALTICQTQGLKSCEQDALDGWREVLEALGKHQRERLLRQLQQSYTLTKRNW